METERSPTTTTEFWTEWNDNDVKNDKGDTRMIRRFKKARRNGLDGVPDDQQHRRWMKRTCREHGWSWCKNALAEPHPEKMSAFWKEWYANDEEDDDDDKEMIRRYQQAAKARKSGTYTDPSDDNHDGGSEEHRRWQRESCKEHNWSWCNSK